jgi:hypothetical protein
MKKTILILLAHTLVMLGLTAQSREGIVFIKTNVNYGSVAKGSDPVKKFTFTNKGNEKLFITNAKGSCGCTVANFPKEVIQPGETGTIEVRYDTNRVGIFNKQVTVTASDGSQHVLSIEGEVLEKEG